MNKKNYMIKKIVLFLALGVLLTSCVSKKKIAYFQNISEVNIENSVNYEPTIKPDDQLMVIVSAPDAEAAIPFNLPAVAVMGNNNSPLDMPQGQLQIQSYLVDQSGNINLPVIGSFKIGGFTREAAMSKLIETLKKYIKNPIVNVRILNYKVSVIGEVLQPGTINVVSERITLPEALSKVGDLTIYGDREKILIIREIDGKRTHNFVDITKADFINSPFYYLSQNDLVYVEPNKTKINSSAVGPNISIIISAASVVLSVVVALILR